MNKSIFKSFPFYIHPKKKKSQPNQHLSNSQPYSQIRFFGSLDSSFSSNYLVPLIKCGRLMAFCITYFLSWRRKQMFHTCTGLFNVLLQGGQAVWKCITEAQSEMLPGQRHNQPGVWRANSVLILAHSIKATISEHFDSRFYYLPWAHIPGQNLTKCTDEIWQLLCNVQRAQLAEKTYTISLGSYKTGNPAAHVWSRGKLHVRVTQLHPDARPRFAVYFRFLPWWGWCKQSGHLFPQTNNMLHG